MISMDISEKERQKVFEALRGSTAVMRFADNVIKNGRLEPIGFSNKITTWDGVSAAPAGFLNDLAGVTSSRKGNETTLILGTNRIKVEDNSSKYAGDAKNGDLGSTVITKDGITYVPVAAVLSALGKYACDIDELVIIGSEKSVMDIRKNKEVLWNLKTMLCGKELTKENIKQTDWKQLKDKWRKYLTGDGNNKIDDERIKIKLDSIDNKCDSARKTMHKDTKILALFGTEPCVSSFDMTKQFVSMFKLVIGYGTYGCFHYKDRALKEDILFALDWLYNNLYGQNEIEGKGWRDTSEYNWWDWYCGSARPLCDALMIMEEDLTPGQIKKYLSLYDDLRTKMRMEMTPACAASRVYTGTAAAALEEDYDRMAGMVNDYNLLLAAVDSGNGIQEDGLYKTHDYFPYAAAYGTECLLGRFTNIQAILAGTAFELATPYKYESCRWMYETFGPITFNGYMTNAQSGRLKRNEDTFTGYFIAAMLDFIGVFGMDDDNRLKQMIRRSVRKENISAVSSYLSVAQLTKLWGIMDDESIHIQPYYKNKIYYTGDSIMHQRNDYGFALSMSSSRIAPWESLNGVNLTGWYQGDGMLYTYIDTDPTQYNLSYWKEANPYHMPGTTVDTQKRIATSIAKSSDVLTKQNFVGAAGFNELYATAAMQLEAYHNDNKNAVLSTEDYGGDAPYHKCTLMAKKAWFMFDDEVVALGSDINAKDGFEVHTVIENRKLVRCEQKTDIKDGRPAGKIIPDTAVITADGIVIEKKSTYRKSFTNPSWVHIEGIAGYWLPRRGELVMDKVTNNESFLEMWLNHGINPDKGTYAYVILPKKTARQTAEYAENPDVEILLNTEAIQAVRENKLKLTGMVFWEPGTFGDITVSVPVIMMDGISGGTRQITVADPTQLLAEGVLTVKGSYKAAFADERCTIIPVGKDTEIKINFDGSKGRTLTIRLVNQV